MRPQDNPFSILGVTPYDSIGNIIAAVEDKIFEDDENESVYEEARSVLVSPSKRLSAEVRWFRVDDNRVVDLTEKLYGNFGDIEFVIEDLDCSYQEIFTERYVSKLFSSINIARQSAQIDSCSDIEKVANELRTLGKDIDDAVNHLFKCCDEKKIVELANNIAESTINKSRQYGEVVEIFMSCYHYALQGRLQSMCGEILAEVNKGKTYTNIDELKILCNMVRQFDHVAQPLQLLLRDKGQSSLQKESIEVAKSIRDLGIYYHNQKGLSNLSKVLVDLEIELFSELTEYLPVFQKDKQFIDAAAEAKESRDKDEKIIHYLRLAFCGGVLCFMLCVFGYGFYTDRVEGTLVKIAQSTVYIPSNDREFNGVFYGQKVFLWNQYDKKIIKNYGELTNVKGNDIDDVRFCAVVRYSRVYVTSYRSSSGKVVPGYQRIADIYVYDLVQRRCLGRTRIHGDMPGGHYSFKHVPDAIYGLIEPQIISWVYSHWR